ncbi:unnamed protein product [Strongylus vulgaris]|uniref:Uncharacterized protein n=1 Tax=Strongylus vulgaris TaxID=40348 RepID=A0A3P7J9J9_STRVU|nr:unnamed protein product [Strongylus vulgaris]
MMRKFSVAADFFTPPETRHPDSGATTLNQNMLGYQPIPMDSMDNTQWSKPSFQHPAAVTQQTLNQNMLGYQPMPMDGMDNTQWTKPSFQHPAAVTQQVGIV